MSEYNGHPSYEHWNVALWLYNDEDMYDLVQQAIRHNYSLSDCAREILDILSELAIECTGDGVEYTYDTIMCAIEEDHTDYWNTDYWNTDD